MREDKECPFNGVTSSGTNQFWRNVPKSDARCVIYSTQTFRKALTTSADSRVWKRMPESDSRSVISTQTFWKGLAESADSRVWMKGAGKRGS